MHLVRFASIRGPELLQHMGKCVSFCGPYTMSRMAKRTNDSCHPPDVGLCLACAPVLRQYGHPYHKTRSHPLIDKV